MEVPEPLRHVQHAFHRLCGCGHPGREHGLQVGATVHVDEVRHAPDREAAHQPHDERMAAHVRDHGFLGPSSLSPPGPSSLSPPCPCTCPSPGTCHGPRPGHRPVLCMCCPSPCRDPCPDRDPCPRPHVIGMCPCPDPTSGPGRPEAAISTRLATTSGSSHASTGSSNCLMANVSEPRVPEYTVPKLPRPITEPILYNLRPASVTCEPVAKRHHLI